jgi:hypothetical protein
MPNRAAVPVQTDPSPSMPWWRVPMVWLVIAGPAIVVVAGFTTLGIALHNPDPVLSRTKAKTVAEMPAVQGRNHAVCPPVE